MRHFLAINLNNLNENYFSWSRKTYLQLMPTSVMPLVTIYETTQKKSQPELFCEYRGTLHFAKHTWTRTVCGPLLAYSEAFEEKDVHLSWLIGLVPPPRSMVTTQGCPRTQKRDEKGDRNCLLEIKEEKLLFQSSLIPPYSSGCVFCMAKVQVSGRVLSHENGCGLFAQHLRRLAKSTGPGSGQCHDSRSLISHCRPQHPSLSFLDTHKNFGAAPLASLRSCAPARISSSPYRKLELLYMSRYSHHTHPLNASQWKRRRYFPPQPQKGQVTLCPCPNQLG